jgi:hypothetical protein
VDKPQHNNQELESIERAFARQLPQIVQHTNNIKVVGFLSRLAAGRESSKTSWGWQGQKSFILEV